MPDLNQLRGLDIEDLWVMTMLLDGVKPSDIARNLRITNPAVSVKLNKYEKAFNGFFESRPIRTKYYWIRKLSPKGTTICQRAKKALEMLLTISLVDMSRLATELYTE